MADPVRDAQSEAPAKERCSNKTSKRRRQNGVATEQSERAPTIASNLQDLYELSDRVLPLESYSAQSSGSDVLLPLLQISEAYRTHLREKDVTAADALSLPPNMRTTGGGCSKAIVHPAVGTRLPSSWDQRHSFWPWIRSSASCAGQRLRLLTQ
jgi:hypothetical protein